MGMENTKGMAQPASAYRFDFHYPNAAAAAQALGDGLGRLFRLRPGLWIKTALNEVRGGYRLRVTICGSVSDAVLVRLVF